MVAGECLCGAVRYEIEGSITGAWLCHCSKCRRANGSAFQAGAVAGEGGFRWVRGEDRVSEYRAASGYRRAFCGTCASPVPLRVEGTAYVWLPVGGLEGDPGVRPTHHIFVGSRAPWFQISDGLPQFDEHAERPRD
jgi:hypothetical protein